MKSSNGEIAEKLFLEACALQGWSAAKIPTGLTKTPDYKVESKSGSYIAEVKQISLSGYELGKAHSFKVGAKIRSAIGDAKNQLRDLELPTMLVVCDLRGAGLATYENIVAAMYGELTVTVDKHTGAIEGPFHGRNAQMRNNVNTSISAVAQVSYDLTNYDGNQ
ncbi:MAG: hypothetical protein KJ667_09030, partial [Alphaproteobacteria bacterium]|nr:hypothetical protein [Alphaproteobacteria bacterium]